ncbi:MAG: ROK family protein [Planctomycetaceae bacterium]|jgi:glucokinase|nr:ROK family protein [Planctomycetaceae bacterium]
MNEERIYLPVSEAAAPLYLGIHFGSFNLKIGVIDSEGHTVSYFATPHNTAECGPDGAARNIAAAVRETLEKTGIGVKDITAAGISFPGSLDPRTEKLHRPPNFPDWLGYPLPAKLMEYTGLQSVLFCNNANAAAYGEFWIGAARDSQSVCLVLLDDGIGCGTIVEGREIKGANGFGGEFGHIIIDPSPGARWCNCLQQGHLEAYASATAVARRTREMLEVGLSTSLQDRIDKDTPLADIPKLVFDEADRGDALAMQIVLDTARFLGLGIVSLLHTLDPECVLLGGEMTFGIRHSGTGEMFLKRVREEIDQRALKDLTENLKLGFAKLGANAGFVGAAGLAREEALLLTVVE